MEHRSPEHLYKIEKEKGEQELVVLQRKQTNLGWLRLAIILFTIVLSFYFFSFSLGAGWLAISIGVSIFLFIVSVDANNSGKLKNVKRLLTINEEELQILNNNYGARYDGADLGPSLHDYANDLDVVGVHSLYQYVQRCNSEQGRRLLADNLLYGISEKEITERQVASKELAPQLNWRQQLQAYSLETQVRLATQQSVEKWLQEKQHHFVGKHWNWIVNLYSFLAVGTAILCLFGYISGGLFTGLFLFYLIFSGSLSKPALKAYIHLSGKVEEIETMSQLIKWIEGKEFNAPMLKQLQESVQVKERKAFQQIDALKQILNRFDLRLNIVVFILLNSFLLWDVRQMIALNKWRITNAEKVSDWYKLIANFEVLTSISSLHLNQPGWTIPKIEKEHFTIDAKDIGHPLLPAEQRVSSHFLLKGKSKVALVTGSNMAGKSTFLRSLGVNIVLAQMGAPVCASSFSFSPVQVMSSMRIADNLAENTSTFYAELKKLKTIIDAVNDYKPIFILLDEILRGTNSLDRHTGSEALIRQLIKKGAVAVIATHDLALASLNEGYPEAIENYHFDVQVDGEELYFDYKLKEGVCTSLNASILMKKIGIEMS